MRKNSSRAHDIMHGDKIIDMIDVISKSHYLPLQGFKFNIKFFCQTPKVSVLKHGYRKEVYQIS